MSTRQGRRRTGGTRHGLFDALAPDGDVRPAEVTDQPRRRPCPTCGASAGEACTSPSKRRGARRRISGYHQARTTPTTPPSTEDR